MARTAVSGDELHFLKPMRRGAVIMKEAASADDGAAFSQIMVPVIPAFSLPKTGLFFVEVKTVHLKVVAQILCKDLPSPDTRANIDQEQRGGFDAPDQQCARIRKCERTIAPVK